MNQDCLNRNSTTLDLDAALQRDIVAAHAGVKRATILEVREFLTSRASLMHHRLHLLLLSSAL